MFVSLNFTAKVDGHVPGGGKRLCRTKIAEGASSQNYLAYPPNALPVKIIWRTSRGRSRSKLLHTTGKAYILYKPLQFKPLQFILRFPRVMPAICPIKQVFVYFLFRLPPFENFTIREGLLFHRSVMKNINLPFRCCKQILSQKMIYPTVTSVFKLDTTPQDHQLEWSSFEFLSSQSLDKMSIIT